MIVQFDIINLQVFYEVIVAFSLVVVILQHRHEFASTLGLIG